MSLYSFVLTLLLFFAAPAHAWIEKAISVVDPTTFAPNDLALENFELKTTQPYEWVKGSF